MCNGVDWTNAWEEDMVGVLDASGVRLNRRRFLAEIQGTGIPCIFNAEVPDVQCKVFPSTISSYTSYSGLLSLSQAS